jgi:hypothetical protein
MLYRVRAYKKQLVAFLVTAVTVGAMLVVCSAKSATGQPEQEKPNCSAKSATGQPEQEKPKAETQGLKFTTGSLFASDPNFSSKQGNSSGNKELFYKMMLSVLLVVALGAAAIYTSRKLLPRITNLPGKEIRVVETIHIGPEKRCICSK